MQTEDGKPVVDSKTATEYSFLNFSFAENAQDSGVRTAS